MPSPVIDSSIAVYLWTKLLPLSRNNNRRFIHAHR